MKSKSFVAFGFSDATVCDDLTSASEKSGVSRSIVPSPSIGPGVGGGGRIVLFGMLPETYDELRKLTRPGVDSATAALSLRRADGVQRKGHEEAKGTRKDLSVSQQRDDVDDHLRAR